LLHLNDSASGGEPEFAESRFEMHNGRFARNVVERAERLRDSRVAAQNRTDRGSVTIADLETLRAQDILAAVTDACSEKHVPITL
jgi:hypothetical protein